MRLWSIHPKYLDSAGLVALWRESLLAQKVLMGETKGYKHHPQLIRFQRTNRPLNAISTYLFGILEEANKRGYKFDYSKIMFQNTKEKITVNKGQLTYEFDWLRQKLYKRDLNKYHEIKDLKEIATHPLFMVIDGPIEEWEKK